MLGGGVRQCIVRLLSTGRARSSLLEQSWNSKFYDSNHQVRGTDHAEISTGSRPNDGGVRASTSTMFSMCRANAQRSTSAQACTCGREVARAAGMALGQRASSGALRTVALARRRGLAAEHSARARVLLPSLGSTAV